VPTWRAILAQSRVRSLRLGSPPLHEKSGANVLIRVSNEGQIIFRGATSSGVSQMGYMKTFDCGLAPDASL
jgi:hypothetical protein